jgi:hypothetical protein
MSQDRATCAMSDARSPPPHGVAVLRHGHLANLWGKSALKDGQEGGLRSGRRRPVRPAFGPRWRSKRCRQYGADPARRSRPERTRSADTVLRHRMLDVAVDESCSARLSICDHASRRTPYTRSTNLVSYPVRGPSVPGPAAAPVEGALCHALPPISGGWEQAVRGRDSATGVSTRAAQCLARDCALRCMTCWQIASHALGASRQVQVVADRVDL